VTGALYVVSLDGEARAVVLESAALPACEAGILVGRPVPVSSIHSEWRLPRRCCRPDKAASGA
jgi:hypothetical protein